MKLDAETLKEEYENLVRSVVGPLNTKIHNRIQTLLDNINERVPVKSLVMGMGTFTFDSEGIPYLEDGEQHYFYLDDIGWGYFPEELIKHKWFQFFVSDALELVNLCELLLDTKYAGLTIKDFYPNN